MSRAAGTVGGALGVALLLAPLVAGADTAPPGSSPERVTPNWNQRCHHRFDEAQRELADLGAASVEAHPGTSHLTSYGLVRLTLRRKDGKTLTAEVDTDRSPTLYRGHKGLYEKDHRTWHSPYKDSQSRPTSGREPALYLERHQGVPHGTMRGEIKGDVADEATSRFTAVLQRTIEGCLADVRTDELDPTVVWRRRCGEDLEAARLRLATSDPAFATGKVTVQLDSVWLKDPRSNARPTFQAMVTCGAYSETEPWHGDAGQQSRKGGRCHATIWIYEFPPAVQAVAMPSLRETLDGCVAAFNR